MAYSLESFLPIAYVLPLVRYIPELALVAARYVLNVASNARWFFGDYLAASAQSRADLPAAVAYEAIHRSVKDGAPYATGDFFGHKSVYGGAMVLWLAQLLRPTEDPYILQMDVTGSDFLAQSYPTTLIYNPWPDERSVHVAVLPEHRAYDLFNHHFVDPQDIFEVPSEGIRMVTWVPNSAVPAITVEGHFLRDRTTVIDYHYPHAAFADQ